MKIASNLYKKIDAITGINSIIQSKGAMSMGNLSSFPYYLTTLYHELNNLYMGGG